MKCITHEIAKRDIKVEIVSIDSGESIGKSYFESVNKPARGGLSRRSTYMGGGLPAQSMIPAQTITTHTKYCCYPQLIVLRPVIGAG